MIVYRPGMITGHSLTGYCNVNDFVARFMLGIAFMKSFPLLEDPSKGIDMTPVDVVAKIIVMISKQANSTGKTFRINIAVIGLTGMNIRCKDVVPYVRIGRELCEMLKNIDALSYREWKFQLDNSQANNPLYHLAPYFPSNESLLLSSPSDVDIQNTLSVLIETNTQSLLSYNVSTYIHLCIVWLLKYI